MQMVTMFNCITKTTGQFRHFYALKEDKHVFMASFI